MTLTIQIQPEVEPLLRAVARKRGVALEEVVASCLNFSPEALEELEDELDLAVMERARLENDPHERKTLDDLRAALAERPQVSDLDKPTYRIIIERSAWRQLMKLEDKTQGKVADAIYELEKEPRPSGCKKLKGAQLSYRIRVGDFRVLYEVHDDILIVLVVTIGDRKEVYD